MNPADLSVLNWRETRIFTSDNSPRWYFRLLALIAKPFESRFSGAPFWFTRYECANRVDPVVGFDLEPRFRFSVQGERGFGTRSLRFRFATDAPVQEFFDSQISLVPGLLCYSPVLPYNFLSFAEPRLCVVGNEEFRTVRANIVSHLLCWNSKLVLHAMTERGGEPVFEENLTAGVLRSSFVQALHLMNNVYGGIDGCGFTTVVQGSLSNPLTGTGTMVAQQV